MRKTVYVAQAGASLRREGNLLVVQVGKERRASIPTHDLGQLVLLGNVVLTPSALDLIVESGIDAVLLSHGGRYRGRIGAGPSGNVGLRLAQYAALTAPARALEVARTIVKGKAANQRTFLLKHARRHGLTDSLRRAAVAIRAACERCDLAEDLDEVRGCEGAASAAYFRVFGELVRAEGFRFDGRNRRPPMDPVNALLSLGYTLLLGTVEAAIQIVGLDPYLGSLHAPLANRPSLACDLVEEYRAALVAPLVVAAVHHQAIAQDGIEASGPGEPVVMKREAITSLVQAYERRLAAHAHYPPAGARLTWRGIVEQQVRLFARAVLGQERYACVELR